MFCLLKFNNVDTDETQQLMHELSGNPNGTLIDKGIPIYFTELNKLYPKYDTRLYWIDDKYLTQNSIINLCKLKPIGKFTKLYKIGITIYDNEWQYEDSYLNSVFYEQLLKHHS